MSPKPTHKGPQRKPNSDMASVLQRRRDGDAASGGTDADAVASVPMQLLLSLV